jgi:hypothetical protein
VGGAELCELYLSRQLQPSLCNATSSGMVRTVGKSRFACVSIIPVGSQACMSRRNSFRSTRRI